MPRNQRPTGPNKPNFGALGGGPMNTPSTSSSHWKSLKVIGEGTLTTVELVKLDEKYSKHFDTAYAALKTTKGVGAMMSPVLKEKLMREEIHSKRPATSPNLVKYFKFSRDTTSQRVVILMELMNLESMQTVNDQLKTAEVNTVDRTKLSRCVGIQVLLGLQYLHLAEGVMHRDIKLDNVLINAEGRVKICDFDTARAINPSSNGQSDPMQADTVTGTPGCMAPEVVKGQRYSEKCDMWSFAGIMYQLATGEQPYDPVKPRSCFSESVDLSKIEDPELRSLLARMFVDDPAQRISCTDAIAHPFFEPVYAPNATLVHRNGETDTQGMAKFSECGIRVGTGTDFEWVDFREMLAAYKLAKEGVAENRQSPAMMQQKTGSTNFEAAAAADASGSPTLPQRDSTDTLPNSQLTGDSFGTPLSDSVMKTPVSKETKEGLCNMMKRLVYQRQRGAVEGLKQLIDRYSLKGIDTPERLGATSAA